ncbi:MAG: histidine kinase N-terminal 7TM domain-containing protein [Bacillota bacterium]|nr:histidine kinase N-terminal 7TM domain-containing protein [Bacillota bacterium]
MYNTLLIIQYISILFLLVETGYIFAKWRTTLHGYLFLNCAATLVNNTGYLMEMQAHTQEAYMMGLQMSYLGRVWIPFSLLLFVLALCKIKANKGTIAVLCLIHTVTFLLVLTSQWQPFYYSSMEYVHDGLFPYIKCSHGIWHNFYSALLVAYIVFGITKMLQAFRKEKNIAARKRLLCILVAVAVESGFYIVQLTGITGSYDITVLGYSISTIFMYIAIFKYDLLNMLQLAKDYVIDEVAEGIIAVNTAG